MLEGIPKISVLVITYKQEDIVGRTLDSLISQRDYLYEICISDDCSPDGTWDVLQDYQKRYPDLIKLHRQDSNVGIFENTEYSWSMPTGDIINEIAGDDTTPDGWYKSVVEFIQDNKLDYKNERFCIYCDYQVIYPNGDSMIFKNNLVQKHQDIMYLFLRSIIGLRGVCYSRSVLKRFEKVSQGRSHIAETAQESQIPLNTQKNYYIPFVGNVYFAGIGISTQTSSDKFFDERQQIVPYALSFLESKGVSVDPKFSLYTKANLAEKEYHHNRSLKNLLKMVFCKLRSYDHRIGLKSIGFKQTVFAIRRRLPHRRPIIMYV